MLEKKVKTPCRKDTDIVINRVIDNAVIKMNDKGLIFTEKPKQTIQEKIEAELLDKLEEEKSFSSQSGSEVLDEVARVRKDVEVLKREREATEKSVRELRKE